MFSPSCLPTMCIELIYIFYISLIRYSVRFGITINYTCLVALLWLSCRNPAHFFISEILSFCIFPKSFSSIVLSPMNLIYRKSVVTIGGVLIPARLTPDHTNIVICKKTICQVLKPRTISNFYSIPESLI